MRHFAARKSPRFAGAGALVLLGAAAFAGCHTEATPPPTTSADAGASVNACADTHLAEGSTVVRATPLPNLRFAGLREDGSAGEIALADYFEPCAERSRVLVLRISAGFCGTCRTNAAHTRALFTSDAGPRVRLVDLLVADDDNAPADAGALPGFRKWIDGARALGADPADTFRPLAPGPTVLPLVLLVDTKTMRPVDVFGDPDMEVLVDHVRAAVTKLDGLAPPATLASPKVDGRFAPYEWEMIRAMALPGPPPPDPTNRVADDVDAAALGHALFLDAALSPTGTVACRTCHDPAASYADGQPQSTGVARGARNAPSVALASHARWQFWDGRADSTWMQATGPLENPLEMASSRLFVAHLVQTKYREDYEKVFGPLPPLADGARFPPAGKPGDPSFDGMSAADRDQVTRVFVNVGKAIAAHERTIRVLPNALDRYLAGDQAALTDQEKDGLHAFFTVGCAQCHYGGRLTDDAFHVVRFPSGGADGAPEDGRAAVLAGLAASELTRSGPYSDARGERHATLASPSMIGAFKTPPLRGVATTAPYGHGGTLPTLASVVDLYTRSGSEKDPRTTGTLEPWVVPFDRPTADALVAFLGVLRGDPER